MPIKRGDDHPLTVLSDADVLAVRKLYARGRLSLRELAAQYKVDKSTIHRAVRGVRKTASSRPAWPERRVSAKRRRAA